MTSQPSPASVFPRRNLCWLYILIALVAGVLIGRYVLYSKTTGGGPLGNCVASDSTIFASNVTAETCQSRCPTCTWESTK